MNHSSSFLGGGSPSNAQDKDHYRAVSYSRSPGLPPRTNGSERPGKVSAPIAGALPRQPAATEVSAPKSGEGLKGLFNIRRL